MLHITAPCLSSPANRSPRVYPGNRKSRHSVPFSLEIRRKYREMCPIKYEQHRNMPPNLPHLADILIASVTAGACSCLQLCENTHVWPQLIGITPDTLEGISEEERTQAQGTASWITVGLSLTELDHAGESYNRYPIDPALMRPCRSLFQLYSSILLLFVYSGPHVLQNIPNESALPDQNSANIHYPTVTTCHVHTRMTINLSVPRPAPHAVQVNSTPNLVPSSEFICTQKKLVCTRYQDQAHCSILPSPLCAHHKYAALRKPRPNPRSLVIVHTTA